MATDPTWIDNSAGLPAYAGGELRLNTILPFLAGAGASLGIRSGVRQSGSGTDMLVQAQVAPNMTVRVQPGVVAVSGSISATQGPYTWALDATTNVTIATAHATLSRTDLVAARIRDANVDTSGARDGSVIAITGTAGGGVPSLPVDATYITLAQITVPAAAPSITSGNIADKRVFCTSLGGILSCTSTSEPAANTVAPSQLVYRTDVGQIKVSDGAAYQHVAWTPPYLFAYKTADNGSTVSTTLQDDTHLFVSVPANGRWTVESNIGYYADASGDLRVGWSGPAGANFRWNVGGPASDQATPTGMPFNSWRLNLSDTDTVGGAGAPSPVLIMRPSGLLTTGGTSGLFRLRWCQNVSTINGVTTLQDSWIRLTRVG